ncbi:MAG: SDR family NAD(P)-dependent oxidoreductase [Armatimonadetes bacterium]|nr:SDR family NAD(P)-dependent oxidoreductase [Armatimonadota bacterium]
MKEFTGRVAVITGAASGIGRAIAERCAQEGMKVVLADIEAGALEKAEAALRASGATTLSVITDVSRADSVVNLADRTYEAFGAAHLLFNNAGVGGGGFVWENSLADWEWVLGVNLMGVIHGVRAFVPRMLAQGEEAHIVNTASVAGLTSPPGMSAYSVSKHGVVNLSEILHHELTLIGANIKVSALCPGFVKTRILESERNRPNGFAPVQDTSTPSAVREAIRQGVEAGMPPEEVASCVFEAIRQECFYILTHPEYKVAIRQRMEGILNERTPSNPHERTAKVEPLS